MINMINYEVIPNTLLPRKFKDAVDCLARPYLYIDESLYNEIRNEMCQENSDVIDIDGQLYTIGNCDGDKLALMPIIHKEKLLSCKGGNYESN